MQFSVCNSCSLLEFMKQCFPESSTTGVKKWIEQGRVEINGRVVRSPIHSLKTGDSVHFLKRIKREDGPLKIIFEDEYFIVIDKPAGILSVDADTSNEPSLHSYLKERHPNTQIGVVHRLDRDTSGVIAFSLDPKAYLSLKEQLKKREMKRRYIVMVEGSLDGEGTWDSWIKEDSTLTMRTVPPLTEGAVQAQTHWKSLGHDAKNSILECFLVTGKKNQIRVQASSAGHPVVGDSKYGSTRNTPRMYLHALSLECIHPISHKKMIFSSPLPHVFFSWISKPLRKALELKLRSSDSHSNKESI